MRRAPTQVRLVSSPHLINFLLDFLLDIRMVNQVEDPVGHRLGHCARASGEEILCQNQSYLVLCYEIALQGSDAFLSKSVIVNFKSCNTLSSQVLISNTKLGSANPMNTCNASQIHATSSDSISCDS